MAEDSASGSSGGGRALPSLNMQAFMRDVYQNEDRIRLRWYLRTKEQRQALGDTSTAIKVLRKKIEAACPKPGGAFKRVLDMKPKDYRHRILPDYEESQMKATIERLGLFKDPSETQCMYPVPPDVHLLLYDGISATGNGRAGYLEERYRLNPESKYRLPLVSSFRHGWRLGDFIKISDIKNPEHVRKRVIDETFYTRSDIPGLSRTLNAELSLLPLT